MQNRRDIDRINSQLEFHLTDHCNLSCKWCAHFSPVARPRYATMDEVIEAMKVIRLIEHKQVNILGGEPLLHPNIDEILDYMGNNMPEDTSTSLSTNGVLLKQMSDKFWDIVKRYDIDVHITIYPAKINYNDLIAFAKSKDVRLSGLANPRLQFSAVYFSEDKRHDPEYAYASCMAKCMQIRDGRLFSCPYAAYIGHINRKYGTGFSHIEGEDYLIIDKIKNASDVVEWRRKPKPFCAYCNYGKHSLKRWESTVEHSMDEWVEN